MSEVFAGEQLGRLGAVVAAALTGDAADLAEAPERQPSRKMSREQPPQRCLSQDRRQALPVPAAERRAGEVLPVHLHVSFSGLFPCSLPNRITCLVAATYAITASMRIDGLELGEAPVQDWPSQVHVPPFTLSSSPNWLVASSHAIGRSNPAGRVRTGRQVHPPGVAARTAGA